MKMYEPKPVALYIDFNRAGGYEITDMCVRHRMDNFRMLCERWALANPWARSEIMDDNKNGNFKVGSGNNLYNKVGYK